MKRGRVMGEELDLYECQQCFDMFEDGDMAPSCADVCWSCWMEMGIAEQQLYEGKEHANA